MPTPRPAPIDPASRPYWTLEDFHALPEDGYRYELAHLELLVTTDWTLLHQRIFTNLLVALGNWLKAHPLGQCYFAPAPLTHGTDTLLKPDLFVVPPEDPPTEEWPPLSTLLLVIEISSPETLRADRFPKRRIYQEAAIPLYWLVHPDTQQVEVWTPTDHFPRVETERLTWHPAGAAEPCIIEYAALFG